MKRVELSTAYRWCCEECGVENFAMPIKAEFVDGEREQAFRTFHNMDEWEPLPDQWEGFEMVHIPELVKCAECGSQFSTEDERSVPPEI